MRKFVDIFHGLPWPDGVLPPTGLQVSKGDGRALLVEVYRAEPCVTVAAGQGPDLKVALVEALDAWALRAERPFSAMQKMEVVARIFALRGNVDMIVFSGSDL